MPGKVAGVLGECFGVSADAGYFFLAAWSVWAGRRFKGWVTSEEVLRVLEGQGAFVDGRSDGCACNSGASDSAGCVGELLKAGFFEERVGFDVCFSPVGTLAWGRRLRGFGQDDKGFIWFNLIENCSSQMMDYHRISGP